MANTKKDLAQHFLCFGGGSTVFINI